MTVTVNGYAVTAYTGMRNFLIRADDDAIKWIRTGLQQALEHDFSVDPQAMSQQLIASCEDKVFHYTGNRPGVRDKNFWDPDKCPWGLTLKRPHDNIEKVCMAQSPCLKVKTTLSGDEFRAAREKAFIHACQAWNALDSSSKQRITLPEPTTKFPVIRLGGVSSAVSQPHDSDSSRVSDSSDEECREDESGEVG